LIQKPCQCHILWFLGSWNPKSGVGTLFVGAYYAGNQGENGLFYGKNG